MAQSKRDYRTEGSTYEALVRTNTDTKVVVPVGSQRDRAEIYDAIEDFFRGGKGSITPDKDRAIMHTMVSSFFNMKDDLIDANDIDWSRVPTTLPRDANKVWNDRGALKIS